MVSDVPAHDHPREGVLLLLTECLTVFSLLLVYCGWLLELPATLSARNVQLQADSEGCCEAALATALLACCASWSRVDGSEQPDQRPAGDKPLSCLLVIPGPSSLLSRTLQLALIRFKAAPNKDQKT